MFSKPSAPADPMGPVLAAIENERDHQAPPARPAAGPMALERNASDSAVVVATSSASEGWQSRALCAQTDPELFFPDQGESPRAALRVCRRCEVRAECLAAALDRDERFGVWGGTTEMDRRRIRRTARQALARVSFGGEAA